MRNVHLCIMIAYVQIEFSYFICISAASEISKCACLHCLLFLQYIQAAYRELLYFTHIIKSSMQMVVVLCATRWGQHKINHHCCYISAEKLFIHHGLSLLRTLICAHIHTLPKGFQMAICHAVICVYAISVETSPLCPAETTTIVKTHSTYTEPALLTLP